jgi:predicted CXXCH cytochrome family protein
VELLLRRTLAGTGGDTVDHELSGSRLRLGSTEKADFQLPGLPSALTIRPARDGALRLETGDRSLYRDGKASGRATLAVGDALEFAGLTLRVFEPPAGFDAALEVLGEPTGASPGTVLAAPVSPWSLRRTSWLLILGVLLLALGVPLALTLGGGDVPAAVAGLPAVPTDRLWTSGPLSAAHRTAGLDDDCATCHEAPFRMVADAVCTDCHAALHEHAPVHDFAGLELAGARCAGCHREHNEPARLVRRDRGLCVDCHGEPAPWRRPGSDTPLPVHAFTDDGHPAFRLSYWRPVGTGASLGWERVRTRSEPAAVEEQSGLRFDHAVHLDADKVQTPTAREALDCGSCHEDAGDGEHFAPVTMDAHCRDCHSLAFDPFDPDIELPHGSTRAAFEAMEAHFIREFTDPALRAERSRQKPRRLPGKRLGAASCEGDGLACGRAEAASEAAYQFADTGCVTCHEVIDTGAEAAIDRWFVHPVRLTADWYPQARFDHRAHLTLGDRSGDSACGRCHEAGTSTRAADALMPRRDLCLDCHHAERAPSAVDCVACHSFHRAEGTLSTAARQAPGAGP